MMQVKLAPKGVEVIGFPCNQFGLDEPARSPVELRNALKYVRPGLGQDTPIMLGAKIDVNGEDEHPIYTFLKRSCPQVRTGFRRKDVIFTQRFNARDVRWNYEKFLIDPTNGVPFRRYSDSVEPKDIYKDIDYLMKKLQNHQMMMMRPQAQHHVMTQPSSNSKSKQPSECDDSEVVDLERKWQARSRSGG